MPLRNFVTRKDAIMNVHVRDQLSIMLTDVPGELARIAEAMQKADVNIEGSSAIKMGGTGVRFVVDKVDAAKAAVAALGLQADSQKVVVVSITDDKPGMIAQVARMLSDQGINIDNFYHASTGRNGAAMMYILVGDEMANKAVEALSGM